MGKIMKNKNELIDKLEKFSEENFIPKKEKVIEWQAYRDSMRFFKRLAYINVAIITGIILYCGIVVISEKSPSVYAALQNGNVVKLLEQE